jgi:hypothetical protein
MAAAAYGQQFDLAFGVGTVSAPSSTTFNGDFNHSPQTIGGGAYPVFSGDFLLKKDFGVQAEIAWRATRNLYLGFQPYRPIFFDFNGLYAPHLGKFVEPELTAGIGVEDVRFYQNVINCNFVTCTNFVSSKHFMGHFGAGLRLYAHGNFFIRPEAHLYLVRNNVEFTSARATRYGLSIGYTFGGR